MFEPKKFSEVFDAMRSQASGVLTDFEPGSVSRTGRRRVTNPPLSFAARAKPASVIASLYGQLAWS